MPLLYHFPADETPTKVCSAEQVMLSLRNGELEVVYDVILRNRSLPEFEKSVDAIDDLYRNLDKWFERETPDKTSSHTYFPAPADCGKIDFYWVIKSDFVEIVITDLSMPETSNNWLLVRNKSTELIVDSIMDDLRNRQQFNAILLDEQELRREWLKLIDGEHTTTANYVAIAVGCNKVIPSVVYADRKAHV